MSSTPAPSPAATSTEATTTGATSPQTVDLAIIGSGSGNSIPDDRFDDRSIAIFEEGIYGGTCLNVGCIPTKMFVYPGEVVETAKEAEKLGVSLKFEGADWPSIVQRVFGEKVDLISAGGLEYREERCPNITVYRAHVRFDGRTDDGLYRLVTDRTETAEAAVVLAREVVIAAGSRATAPPAIADSAVRYYTNNDVMRLPELPRKLIVVGGGYIAAEFAHVFGALGSEVTVVARGEKLLRWLDADISERFTEIAAQQWDVRLNEEVTAAQTTDDGGVRLTLTSGAEVTGDVVLVATGRQPNGDRLTLDTIGVPLTDDGRVTVDAQGRTPAENVWAIGDVSSPYMLKHVANHEQRVVQANLLKGWSAADLDAFDHRFVPAAVFTHPQIATVGLTESQAHDAGLDVAVKLQAFGDVAYGWAMDDSTGLCKLIADRTTGQLVGAHILGPQAPTMIQPAIQAMSFGLGVAEMARGQYWIHPALAEVLENALLGLEL